MRLPQLHRTLAALVLVASLTLLSPTAAWAWPFGPQIERALPEAREALGLSPARWLQALLAVWASSGVNPNGAPPTTDNGSGLDPNGGQSTGDIGSGLDPHG